MRTLLRVLLWSCLVMVTWSLYVLNISPPAEAEAGDHEDLASSLQPATSGTSAGEAGRGSTASPVWTPRIRDIRDNVTS